MQSGILGFARRPVWKSSKILGNTHSPIVKFYTCLNFLGVSPSNFALELLGIYTGLTRRALAIHSGSNLGHSGSTLGHMECCGRDFLAEWSACKEEEQSGSNRQAYGEQSASNRRVVADLLFLGIK